MINALRRKFTAIAMCSVFVVLAVIIGAINITNYYSVNQNADHLLNILAENGGVFPKPYDMPSKRGEMPGKDTLGHSDFLSPEAPFATRYFTVLMRRDGTVIAVDTGRIAAVSTETATAYAEALFAKGKTTGFRGSYKYRLTEHPDGVMYLFLDCRQDLSNFYAFLAASVSISLVAMVLVFILVLFFSKRAVKPVAESYEKQKRFITDASHELKTPLTIIDANTEILEMENGENDWTASIKNQVKRLTSLTEKLVLLSRMDEADAVLQMTDFSLSDAIGEAAQPFEAVAAARGKAIHMEIEGGVSYYGDEAALRQLVCLLLDNAVKYASKNGTIALRFHTAGKNKVLTIQNPVDEIQTGKLELLFDRFYRPDASRCSETGGYGIGLSVARAIVTAHKGKISATSEDGRSILFTVLL